MKLSKDSDFLICTKSLAIHRPGAKSGEGEHGVVLKFRTHAIICQLTKKKKINHTYIYSGKKEKEINYCVFTISYIWAPFNVSWFVFLVTL